VRLYTLPELIAMFDRAGLVFSSAFGDFEGADYDRGSLRLIVVAARSAPTLINSTATV